MRVRRGEAGEVSEVADACVLPGREAGRQGERERSREAAREGEKQGDRETVIERDRVVEMDRDRGDRDRQRRDTGRRTCAA